MSFYGGTITVEGRNLITSLLAGETIEFTRIWVGSGAMPDGVEPIDMTALVAPVAEAASTIPTVENGVLSMVVEYRNDMNGGLAQGFWLREFGIFAKTTNSEEVLLYYATLGDSPQPVNAYQDNRIDIRRYPVTIALEVEANIQVTYNPGSFLTAGEAQELLGAMFRKAFVPIVSITIPAMGWTVQESDDQSVSGETEDYPLVLDVVCEGANDSLFPHVSLDRSSLDVANVAGLCPTIQALDGILRFWAKKVPSKDMYGTAAFLISGTMSGNGGGDSAYVLPAATSTTLGGVKVQQGSGLTIDGEGNLAIDAATESETEDVYEDTAGIPSAGVVVTGVKIREGSALVVDEDGYLDVNTATDEETEDIYESASEES